MTLGLVGRKIGMTRIFTDDGKAVPVTVLDVANNRVTQIKTQETDGYSAVQVAFGKRRASRAFSNRITLSFGNYCAAWVLAPSKPTTPRSTYFSWRRRG